MKTLLSPPDRNEILDRLNRVRRDIQPRWGTMSAHQMICHLSDSFRASLVEKYVSASGTVLKRALFKVMALWSPLPWPRGIKTRPEMDQQQGGRHPRSLHQIWRSSVRSLTASVLGRATSLLTRCLVRCRGLSVCATPNSTWTTICGSLELRATFCEAGIRNLSTAPFPLLSLAVNKLGRKESGRGMTVRALLHGATVQVRFTRRK
jgi:hypothetical protein